MLDLLLVVLSYFVAAVRVALLSLDTGRFGKFALNVEHLFFFIYSHIFSVLIQYNPTFIHRDRFVTITIVSALCLY